MKSGRRAVACAALAPFAATAQTSTASAAGALQGLVGLAVVVALIFAAGWAMRKFGLRTRGAMRGAVEVVGGASVGPRERVVVVRFAGQTLLVGVAPGQVSLLHAAAPGVVVTTPVADSSAAPRFVDRLRAARGGA